LGWVRSERRGRRVVAVVVVDFAVVLVVVVKLITGEVPGEEGGMRS